jgi:hypothetical protein
MSTTAIIAASVVFLLVSCASVHIRLKRQDEKEETERRTPWQEWEDELDWADNQPRRRT